MSQNVKHLTVSVIAITGFFGLSIQDAAAQDCRAPRASRARQTAGDTNTRSGFSWQSSGNGARQKLIETENQLSVLRARWTEIDLESRRAQADSGERAGKLDAASAEARNDKLRVNALRKQLHALIEEKTNQFRDEMALPTLEFNLKFAAAGLAKARTNAMATLVHNQQYNELFQQVQSHEAAVAEAQKQGNADVVGSESVKLLQARQQLNKLTGELLNDHVEYETAREKYDLIRHEIDDARIAVFQKVDDDREIRKIRLQLQIAMGDLGESNTDRTLTRTALLRDRARMSKLDAAERRLIQQIDRLENERNKWAAVVSKHAENGKYDDDSDDEPTTTVSSRDDDDHDDHDDDDRDDDDRDDDDRDEN